MEGMINEDEESNNEAWKRWDDIENTTYNHETRDYKETNKEIRKPNGHGISNLDYDLIKRFEMIKYSFGHDEKCVAIKEHEYDDLTRTNEDACRGYQGNFQSMDEGWVETRDE
ncbi:hypothetical protein Tco_1466836 [Tanacetum coccineum]